MGYKSTLYITREEAVREILNRLPEASDVAIANILEALGDSEGPASEGIFGYNYIITEKKDEIID